MTNNAVKKRDTHIKDVVCETLTLHVMAIKQRGNREIDHWRERQNKVTFYPEND